MKKTKKILINMAVAGSSLVMAGAGLFGIQEVIKNIIGYELPDWLCWILATIGLALAVITVCVSCGVWIPDWASYIVAGLTSGMA